MTRVGMWSMLVVGAVIGLGVVLLWPSPSGRPAEVGHAPAVVRRETAAAQVLRLWDRERSAAWAMGDATALSGLYVAGVSAGQEDVRMLQQWASRGLRVEDLSMQVLSLEVVDQGAGWWLLRVTDRIAGADVVGPGSEAEMPAGAVRTRVLELREQDGTWRMQSVKAA